MEQSENDENIIMNISTKGRKFSVEKYYSNHMKHKHILCIFILILVCINIQAQTEPSLNRYSFSCSIAPNYCNRFVANSKELNAIKICEFSYTTSDQIAKAGLSARIIFSYRFNKHLSLNTGVEILRMGYNTSEFQDSTVYNATLRPSDMIIGKLKYSFVYLSIPVILSDRIDLSKKWALEFGAGANLNLVNWSNISCLSKSDLQYSFENFRKLNLGACLNAQFHYRISEKISVFFGPVFHLMFFPVNDVYARDGANKNIYLYSAGISSGFNYHIGQLK